MTFGICLNVLVMIMLCWFDRGGVTSWWRHYDVYLLCYWDLLLFYHRTCRFYRKTHNFPLQWESFVSIIWNLYIARKKTELNLRIYFVRLYSFIFISEKKKLKEHHPMASRSKRKFLSVCDQEQLLEEIYDPLNKDDSEF